MCESRTTGGFWPSAGKIRGKSGKHGTEELGWRPVGLVSINLQVTERQWDALVGRSGDVSDAVG